MYYVMFSSHGFVPIKTLNFKIGYAFVQRFSRSVDELIFLPAAFNCLDVKFFIYGPLRQ